MEDCFAGYRSMEEGFAEDGDEELVRRSKKQSRLTISLLRGGNYTDSESSSCLTQLSTV